MTHNPKKSKPNAHPPSLVERIERLEAVVFKGKGDRKVAEK